MYHSSFYSGNICLTSTKVMGDGASTGITLWQNVTVPVHP